MVRRLNGRLPWLVACAAVVMLAIAMPVTAQSTGMVKGVVKDAQGRPLWDAAVPMTDAVQDLPYGILAVPGRDIGLQLLLTKQDGIGIVLIQPYRAIGTDTTGQPIVENLFPMALAIGETGISQDTGLSVQLTEVSEYTLLIAKHDPGQGLVWLAFVSLIAGIVITFYFPRRRVWTRLDPTGKLGIVWRSDRYVDVEREFGQLLDDLVAVRAPIQSAMWASRRCRAATRPAKVLRDSSPPRPISSSNRAATDSDDVETATQPP